MELVEAHIARRYRELGVSAARLREVRPFLLEHIDSEYPLASQNFQFNGAYKLHDLSLTQPEACNTDAMAVFERHEGGRSGSWRHLPGLSMRSARSTTTRWRRVRWPTGSIPSAAMC